VYVVCVRIEVVPDHVEAFVEATLANARATRQEPGNARFDVLRHTEDPARFFLYEAYHDEESFRAHQQTPHYLTWRETVAPFMAVPRIGDRHLSLFPDPWD
jgi:(4S)-4-hydroxy-5-phosphonooxypentane-2,3-dione isomerase